MNPGLLQNISSREQIIHKRKFGERDAGDVFLCMLISEKVTGGSETNDRWDYFIKMVKQIKKIVM